MIVRRAALFIIATLATCSTAFVVPLGSSALYPYNFGRPVSATSNYEALENSREQPKASCLDDTALEYLFQETDTPVMFFDGVCQFCNESVHACYDLEARLRFCSLRSATGQKVLQTFGRSPNDISSLIVLENASTAHFESDAVLCIVSKLQKVPAPIRTMVSWSQYLPKRVRNDLYHVVSDHRHLWKSNSDDGPTCRVDLPPDVFVRDDDEL